MNRLPQFEGTEGPVPDPQRPLNALLKTDLSPAAIQTRCSTKLPSIRITAPTAAAAATSNVLPLTGLLHQNGIFGSGTIVGSDASNARKRDYEEVSPVAAAAAESVSMDPYRYRMRRKMVSAADPFPSSGLAVQTNHNNTVDVQSSFAPNPPL